MRSFINFHYAGPPPFPVMVLYSHEGANLSTQNFRSVILNHMYCLGYMLRAANLHIASPSIILKGNCPVV